MFPKIVLTYRGWTVTQIGKWFHAKKGSEGRWIWCTDWFQATESLKHSEGRFRYFWLESILPA